MTSEDRELLQALRQRQADLQRSLARLDFELGELEARAAEAPEPVLPDLPPLPLHVDLPAIPVKPETHVLPPLPVANVVPPAPPKPPPAPVSRAQPSLEFQLGRWLTRMGAVLLVLSIASFATWVNVKYDLIHRIGPWGKLMLMGIVSVGAIAFGQRIERRNGNLIFFGRTLMAGGLGGLYVTLYAACSFESLRVIQSPWLGGVLLLWWSAYVLFLAERRRSQTLSLFAITLAYFSTAINPMDRFTMAADLVLAATAVLFMVRNGWAVLSFFSLIGTYLALLRRLVLNEDGEFIFDTSRALHFGPHAAYLVGAWLIFTLGIAFCRSPEFRGGRRTLFISLNNGALGGLLLLTTFIAGYGHGPMGLVLLATGLVFLVTSRFIGWTEIEPENVMAVYAAHGLAFFTLGVVIFYTGITRAGVLLTETLFLGAAGAFAADTILIGCTYVTGLLATLFICWEITVNAHHPWLLGFGGAGIMLLNAWWVRSEFRDSPKCRSAFVLATAYYSVLALGLVFTALEAEMSQTALPPALALAALVLTFLVYLIALHELPPLAQTLLLAAQALVLFPVDTGEDLPWWSTAWVAVITLVLIVWWSRQRITRTGAWVPVLVLVYASALGLLTYQTVRPMVDAQGWLIAASVLSFVFLAWGALTRIWSIAAVGQVFLAVAVVHFFFPPGGWDAHRLVWNGWAAAVPMVVVFATAHAVHRWLDYSPPLSAENRSLFSAVAYGYQIVALAMLGRLIVARVPALDQTAVFLALGTLLVAWNGRGADAFGTRCGLFLSLIGFWIYADDLDQNARALATFLNAFAFLGFLAQPALLRTEGKSVVTPLEKWALIFFAVGANWLFASMWIETRWGFGYITMGWALFALFLFLFGVAMGEERLRWCGLGVLVAAILRVFAYDFWGLSNGYRVLTFIVLSLITFGLGFVILRFSGRAKRPG